MARQTDQKKKLKLRNQQALIDQLNIEMNYIVAMLAKARAQYKQIEEADEEEIEEIEEEDEENEEEEQQLEHNKDQKDQQNDKLDIIQQLNELQDGEEQQEQFSYSQFREESTDQNQILNDQIQGLHQSTDNSSIPSLISNTVCQDQSTVNLNNIQQSQASHLNQIGGSNSTNHNFNSPQLNNTSNENIQILEAINQEPDQGKEQQQQQSQIQNNLI